MEILSKKWVLILINSLLVMSLALLLIFVPIETLEKAVFVIGVLIGFVGLLLIFGAFNYAKESKNMIFWLFQGLFNLVIGFLVIFFPGESIKFLLILAGLWAIVLGVYQLSVGYNNSPEIKGKFWNKLNGAAAVIMGLLLIFAPYLIIGLMVQIFGIVLLAIGGGMLYFALLLRHLGQLAIQAEKIAAETAKRTEQYVDPLEDEELIP